MGVCATVQTTMTKTFSELFMEAHVHRIQDLDDSGPTLTAPVLGIFLGIDGHKTTYNNGGILPLQNIRRP